MPYAFSEIILKFGQEVGMKDVFADYLNIAAGGVLFFALLSCFFGIKLVRLCSAVMTFFLTGIAVCEMLKSTADMGVIVITFAVAGLIAAFLVYYWYEFSVLLFSSMMGYSITAVFSTNPWICLVAAIVVGAVSYPLPPVTLIFSTAVWGGLILGFSGLSYIGVHEPAYSIIVAAGFAALGFYTQCSMNRNHLTPPLGRIFGRVALEKILRREAG